MMLPRLLVCGGAALLLRSECMYKICTECDSHLIIKDPDPYDWFCDDDVAVVCKLSPNPKKNEKSEYLSDRSDFRSVASSCRPYNVKKEAIVPSWCPKNKKDKLDVK